MKPLVATSTKVQTADSYTFGFDDFRCRWAIFTVNNSTGEFAIQSDAGSWSHRWSSAGFTEEERKSSKPLAMFLGKCDPGYVLDKLGYAKTRDLDKDFDIEATIANIRDHICKLRRSGEIKKDSARSAWNELQRWFDVSDFSTEGTRQLAIQDIYNDGYENLGKGIFGHWRPIWESFKYKPSHVHNFLYHDLLPFFKEYLNKEVLNA